MNCPKCKAVVLKGEKECSNCGCKITLKIKDHKSESIVSTNEKVQSNNLNSFDLDELETYLKDVLKTEIALKKHIENMSVIEKKSGRKPEDNPPIKSECVYPKKKTIEKPVYRIWWKKEIAALLITVYFGYEAFNGDEFSLPIFLIAALISVVYPLSIIYDNNKKLVMYNQQVSKEETIYAEECKKIKEENEAKYQEKLSVYEIEYKKQYKEYENYINRIEGELYSIKKELLDKLKDLYDKNILHQKYRNLDAVAAIYDYISTGRCNALEGSDGAYNFYEQRLEREKTDADIKELKTGLKNLEGEIKNQAEHERINRIFQSHEISIFQDRMAFEIELLRDRYSADVSHLLADGQSIF